MPAVSEGRHISDEGGAIGENEGTAGTGLIAVVVLG